MGGLYLAYVIIFVLKCWSLFKVMAKVLVKVLVKVLIKVLVKVLVKLCWLKMKYQKGLVSVEYYM